MFMSILVIVLFALGVAVLIGLEKYSYEVSMAHGQWPAVLFFDGVCVCALVVGFENLRVLFSTCSYVTSIGFSFLEFKFKFEI